ncbi:matrixin family metalloprotease [Nocardioides sp. AX2bis]|uniref:matrixin family metalloprotease n=1 Tax=Nocardioides sp. AX2bis TaxID=2653157 RepID=UPI0012F19933|nr:matrixin family metalloprotease [Nocardioides sp. AX2bis]VXC08647.1 Matrixin [Nocardioides sp. AX2bis]
MLPPQRQRTLTVISVVVTTVALAAYLALAPGTAARVRALVGLEGTARPDSPGTPYTFLQQDPVTQEPVAWDRCRPIEYVVNPAGAPPDWPTVLGDAVSRMERASGLTITSLGETDDRDFEDRDPTGYSPDPVLLGWADEDEVPDLAGDVAGIGGAVATGDTRGFRYRTGAMVLDSDLFADLSDDGRQDVAVAIVLHELGHVVGLDHVDDPGELMNAEGVAPRPRFGPGDLKGLAALADVPCG